MPKCEIRDNSTGQIITGYNFGGPEIYKAGTDYVYAPEGGTSVSVSEGLATLNPLGRSIVIKSKWEIVSHENISTSNWRVTVKNANTGETKSGVYPFNPRGNVYELECQPGTWVIASCGGYKIESSWIGKQANEAYRLKGTGEIISKFKFRISTSETRPYTIFNASNLTIVSDPYFAEHPGPLSMQSCILTAYSQGGWSMSLAGPGLAVPAKGIFSGWSHFSTTHFHITQNSFDLLVTHAKQVNIPALIKVRNAEINDQSLRYFLPGNIDGSAAINVYTADLDGSLIRRWRTFTCGYAIANPYYWSGPYPDFTPILNEKALVAKYFTLVDLSKLPDGDYGE